MATDKVNLSSLNAAMARFQKTQGAHEQAKSAQNGGAMREPAQSADVGDRFERSAEAESYAKLHATLDRGRAAVANQPDVRQDRIDAVQAKMREGKVITPEVREQVSQSLERVMKILDLFVS